jgi:cytochrome c peroxidase
MQRFIWGACASVALIGACASRDSIDESAVTGGSPCEGVQLDASRQYRPRTWTDAHVSFAVGSLSFAIPASIPVTQGNSANGKTKLIYSSGGGQPEVCVYRGNGGTAYNFVKCHREWWWTPDPDDDDDRDLPDGARDPRPVAGDIVTADSFTLHVNRGLKAAGTTAVSLHLGGPVISDGDACTIDACTAEGGVTHTPIDLDDHDDCTVDTCDPSTGPSHTLVDTPVCRGKADFNDGTLAGLGGNGRACSTCHAAESSFQLDPVVVEDRYQTMLASGTDDPLFRPIDANDFRTNGMTAADYTNLRRGLVRITIPLPANVRLLDCGSTVPCPASALPTAETTADVWRSTPSVFNVANTGPDGQLPTWPRGPNTNGGYQLDGRVDTLQNQATGALHNHQQITTDPPSGFLDDITAYEQSLLTPAVPVLTDLQAQGKVIFDRACGQCHGGNAFSTPVVTGRYVDIRTTYPRPVDTATTPRWQFPDASQLAGNVRTYEFTYADGFKVRKTTTDPGRALLTGFLFSAAAPVPPAVCAHPPCGAATGDDFQKFDMAPLHGIINTAPYFHNNSAATLEDVLDQYDQLFLQLEATNPISPVITTMPGLTPPVFDRPLKRVDEDGGAERTALLAYLSVI